MKKFTLGAIAGASALALAVPLIAQFASAQTTASAAAKTRPVASQTCVQAMAAKDGAFLARIDASTATLKSLTQAHQTALVAVAAIADDAQRQTALQTANTTFRTAMKAAMDAQLPAMKTTMDALKTACGDAKGGHGMKFDGMGGFGGPMGGGMGHKGGKGGRFGGRDQ